MGRWHAAQGINCALANLGVMLPSSPDTTAIYTETGRDDSAAEVTLTDGQVLVSSHMPLCWVLLRWNFSVPMGVQILGDAWERGYGDLEWRGISAERVLPWYVLIHDPKTGRTQGLGVQTGAASFASWRVDASGVTLVLDVRNGGLGVRLGGRELLAARVVTRESVPEESPFAFATRFCSALCAAPRLPKQPVYGGNDWYFRYGNISEQTVKSDAALIRSLSAVRRWACSRWAAIQSRTANRTASDLFRAAPSATSCSSAAISRWGSRAMRDRPALTR